MTSSGITGLPETASRTIAGAAQGARKTDETADRFLTLLVTQMRNQDPLNPLDNAQVTTQLAQINTVRGIERLAEKLDVLIGRAEAAQPLAAAALVGRRVLAEGDAIALAGGLAQGGFDLAAAADEVTVRVKDGAGLVLHSARLGPHAPGVYQFTWDGVTDAGLPAAAGNYRFEVEARAAGAPVDVRALMLGRVDAVRTGETGVSLALPGLPPVGLDRVKQIL